MPVPIKNGWTFKKKVQTSFNSFYLARTRIGELAHAIEHEANCASSDGAAPAAYATR